MKSKSTAILLALLLGGLGVHKFYLDQPGQGILYLLFCWTFIPAILGLLEAIVYASMSQEAFDAKYNPRAVAAVPAHQPLVVNVQSSAVANGVSVAQQLRELHELKVQGALSEAEFEEQKRRLLKS
jgi:TM2 domain-containing membrane protein YozV